tara:strand:+ start:367 stop:930 length:564 start_codon:yes stop_codon:yes gene_type:complete
MARDLNAQIETAVEGDVIRTAYLLTIYFDDVTIRWTNYFRDVVIDSNSYLAYGRLLEFDGLEETSDLTISSISVALSGVKTTETSMVLSKYYLDRRLTIERVFFDSNDSIIHEPVVVFDGRMNRPQIEENHEEGSIVISVEASSHFVDFERRVGRHTSDLEQQAIFAGDRGFEFSTDIDKNLIWGKG